MTWTTTKIDERDSDERIEHQSEDEREATATRILNAQKNNTEAMTAKVSAVMTSVNVPDGKVTITAPPPKKAKAKADMVNHPPHYTSHPSGVECIQITEHMGFNLGNALKYIWRADLKGNAVEDLEKAVFYINRELVKRRTK